MFSSGRRFTTSARYAAAICTLIACIYGAVLAARVGLSRLLSEYGASGDSLAGTEQALRFNPSDPEAHYSYALRLAQVGRNDEAVAGFERAISLRFKDYFLWEELGRARDDNGDNKGAIAALRHAISLAPYYSQPHWQLGNVLLREGQRDEAFRELRLAVAGDPALFRGLIDIAWGAYLGDVPSVLAATDPQTDEERVWLARFLVTHNRIEAGMSLVRSTAKISTADRRELITVLIGSGRLSEARELWAIAVPRDVGTNLIHDGGFEASISSDEQGFGWKPMPAIQNVEIVLDTDHPHSGKQSLRVKYSGNSEPQAPAVSQLVLVAPKTHYRLTLAARAQNLASGGQPHVTVSDAADHRVIAQSDPWPRGTADWRQFSVDFETKDSTGVIISVQREVCPSQPCPIFGRAWFDDFSIQPRSR